MKVYDVFISYRRKDGEEIAKSLYRYLDGKGLRVFFDLEKMESGQYFPDQLNHGIKCAPHYILIATPEAFNFTEDNTTGKKDYVLEEMRLACKEYELNSTERTFHVLKAPDFEYIEAHNLPEDIQGVSLPTWLPLKYGVDNNDIFEKVFREITAVNRLNMWYGASRWYEESRSRGGRFERLDICDTILPKAATEKDKHIDIPVNVSFKLGEKEKTLPLFDALKESTDHLYLIGQGGIGKTTSLMKIMTDAYDGKEYSTNTQIPIFVELSFAPDSYGPLYENGKSSFIRRSIFRQIRNDNTLNTIHEKKIRAIDEVFMLSADVAVDPVTDILSKNSPAPEYLLLLDGLNEASTAEIEETGRSVRYMITKEIELLVNECPNVRVVLTSRSDENALNNDNIQKFYLSETDEKSIRKYLADNGKTEAEIEVALSDENLKKAISIPLFLAMYAELSEAEGVSSQGEIMRVFFSEKRKNIYTAQDRLERVERDIIENSEESNGRRITSQMQNFFLDFILPEIAWEMERNNEFYLRIRDIKKIIEPVLTNTDDTSVCGDFGKELFSKYTGDSSKMHTAKVARMIIDRLGDDIEEVTESIVDCCVLSLGILQKTNKKYGFIHHHIRDYFAAVKSINAIRLSIYLFEEDEDNLAFECMDKVFGEKPVGLSVRRFIGETLGECRNRPYLENGKWCYGVPTKKCDRNLIKRTLDIYRNRFDGKNGYAVWSLINILKDVRDDLRGSDFSRLDLSGCSLNGTKLGELGLTANFDGALVGEKQFFCQGHTQTVNSVSFSSDGKYIVTASDDKTAKIWDAKTGECLKTLIGHVNCVKFASYSPDGKYIVTVSEDHAAIIWAAETGEIIRFLSDHNGTVYSAGFSHDNQYIVTASSDNTAKIRSMETYKCIQTLSDHKDFVVSSCFSPDRRFVVTASRDKTAKIWNTDTGECIKTLIEHNDTVNCAVYSPDGKYIATASFDKIRIWDSKTYELVKIFEHVDLVNCIAYSPDGKYIVSASSFDKTAKIWDADTGECIRILIGHKGEVTSAGFSFNGKYVVTSSDDCTAKIWDMTTGICLTTMRGVSDRVNSAEFCYDGKHIVVVAEDQTAKIWNAETSKHILTLTGHSREIKAAKPSPDKEHIVTSSWDETARIWDITTGKCSITLNECRGKAVYSSDGQKIACPSWFGSKIWNAETGKLIMRIEEFNSDIVAISPDGKQIITVPFNEIKANVWDAEAGKYLFPIEGHKTSVISSAIYSPDGKHIVTASFDGNVKVWSSKTGKCLKTLKFEKDIYVEYASFSPDGKYIVTISWDDIVKIWNVSTGKSILKLKTNGKQVKIAKFSPDGKSVATIFSDGTAIVWDSLTGKSISNLTGIGNCVNSFEFSSDGRCIYIYCAFGVPQIWDTLTGKCILSLNKAKYANSFAYNSDTHQIISAGKTVKVWSAATGRCVLTLKAQNSWIDEAEYSLNGKYIVTLSEEKSAKIWNAQTGDCILTFTDVKLAKLSNDGKYIAIVEKNDETLKIWNTEIGKCILALAGHKSRIISVELSYDGKNVAAVFENEVLKIWNIETGKCIITINEYNTLSSSSIFSPDSKNIVTLLNNGTARIWDISANRCLTTFKEHGRRNELERVYSVTYTPDGKYIIAISSKTSVSTINGNIIIWDAKTGENILTSIGSNEDINSISFNHDGKNVLIVSNNRSTKILDSETGECLKSFENIPGLMVSGIDFTCLHPESDFSDDLKELLRQYGAIID